MPSPLWTRVGSQRLGVSNPRRLPRRSASPGGDTPAGGFVDVVSPMPSVGATNTRSRAASSRAQASSSTSVACRRSGPSHGRAARPVRQGPRQSRRMPASAMTFFQTSVSRAIWAAASCGGRARDQGRHVAGHQVVDRRPAAAERHMVQPGAAPRLQELAGEMAGGADARGPRCRRRRPLPPTLKGAAAARSPASPRLATRSMGMAMTASRNERARGCHTKVTAEQGYCLDVKVDDGGAGGTLQSARAVDTFR